VGVFKFFHWLRVCSLLKGKMRKAFLLYLVESGKRIGKHNLRLFQWNSIKTIRLFAFNEVKVDLAFGLSNYQTFKSQAHNLIVNLSRRERERESELPSAMSL